MSAPADWTSEVDTETGITSLVPTRDFSEGTRKLRRVGTRKVPA